MADLAVLLVVPGAEASAPEGALLHAVLAAGPEAGVEWIVAYVPEGPRVRVVRELEARARGEQVSLVFGWGADGQLLAGPAAWLADIPCGWYQSNAGAATARDRAATLLRARGVVVRSTASEAMQARLRPHRPVHRVTDASSFAAAVRDLTLGDEESVSPIPDA